MKITSWNVNSINARLPLLLDWLHHAKPDIVLLQETKCRNETFPKNPLEDLGYNLLIHGQKTFNGVAILSKRPFEEARFNLPHFSDTQARYLEAFTSGLRVASIYVPNGSLVGSEKYTYKIAFFQALENHLRTLLRYREKLIVGGDFNVAPTDADVYDPEKWKGNILVSDLERACFKRLLTLGLSDAVRVLYPEEEGNNQDWYTWWDYRQGAVQHNRGLRIDHFLLSDLARETLASLGVEKELRYKERPSDHAPIWCIL